MAVIPKLGAFVTIKLDHEREKELYVNDAKSHVPFLIS